MKCFTMKVAGAIIAAATMHSAFAEVSADEAKQLGGSVLTVMGSEKAGNKDGSIPEYTGQPISIPGIDPKEPGYRPDPFANEKPLFTITAQNAGTYADKIDGYAELFKKYPGFRIDVYRSQRTVVLPKHVIENTLKNATSCKAVQNELVLQGCYGGIPFPIPKSGNQVMWNHLMAYEVATMATNTQQYIVPAGGRPVMNNASVGVQSWPIFEPGRTKPNQPNDIYWRLRLDYTGPARQVGEKLVILDAMDQVNVGRRVYQYIPGQRRVKLAPDLAYDTPNPTAGGSSTMDDSKVFLGALDRFDFKLVGKKEKFLPYNSYKTVDYKACPFDKLLSTQNFPNPDCVRFELHRVWAVEANLKPGFRHVYKKRRFFFDEDGYSAGNAEDYDAANKLYRMVTSIQYPYPGDGANFSTNHSFDLQTGMYAVSGQTNFAGGGFWARSPVQADFFSPEALAAEGVR